MSTTTTTGADQVRLLAQPKAVYAVAFACVILFMGIGLVDPILPSLRNQLKAPRARSRCCSPATWSSRRLRCC